MDLTWLSNLLRNIDWATASNIAVVVSIPFIIRQIREARYTTLAQAYSTIVEILQEEKIRQARKVVFSLKEKSPAKWTKKEIEAAENVCHTYDIVGQMTRNHLLPMGIIIDNWGSSLRSSWPILSQLVNKYRNDFKATEYWDDYEWLYVKAVRFNNRKQRLNRLITGYYIRQLLINIKSKACGGLHKRKTGKTIVKHESKT